MKSVISGIVGVLSHIHILGRGGAAIAKDAKEAIEWLGVQGKELLESPVVQQLEKDLVQAVEAKLEGVPTAEAFTKLTSDLAEAKAELAAFKTSVLDEVRKLSEQVKTEPVQA